jgi:hypothetical protein
MSDTDKKAVEAVVQAYVQGTIERDVTILRTAFHENAVMSGYLGPNKLIGSTQPFYDHLEANEHGPGYSSTISGIEVTGHTAKARLMEENLYGMNFVNDFHLLNDDGSWKIVSKLFHHD